MAGNAPATWRATLRHAKAPPTMAAAPSRARRSWKLAVCGGDLEQHLRLVERHERHVAPGMKMQGRYRHSEADVAHGLERGGLRTGRNDSARARRLAARRHNPLAHPAIERCRCGGIDGIGRRETSRRTSPPRPRTPRLHPCPLTSRARVCPRTPHALRDPRSRGLRRHWPRNLQRLPATKSPSGNGVAVRAAMSATRRGIDVTTITGTPAARISAARRPASSEKPATITAMSSPS